MDTSHKFGSGAFEPNLASALKFEIKSFIGRTISSKQRKPKFPLLHVGCGANVLDGFENVDFYALRFWRARHVGHDFRYPLPYGDATFEGVFSEHTLEHLPPSYARKLLSEMHRVLKPGSVARIAVPDLKKYVDYYKGDRSNPAFDKHDSGCEAIWSLTQNWGHLSCWDAEMLTSQMLEAGFNSPKEVSYLNGSDKRLLRDLADRRWETLYVEATA